MSLVLEERFYFRSDHFFSRTATSRSSSVELGGKRIRNPQRGTKNHSNKFMLNSLRRTLIDRGFYTQHSSGNLFSSYFFWNILERTFSSFFIIAKSPSDISSIHLLFKVCAKLSPTSFKDVQISFHLHLIRIFWYFPNASKLDQWVLPIQNCLS